MTGLLTAVVIMGGVLMMTAMILGYFRWFYDKTDQGQRSRDYYR